MVFNLNGELVTKKNLSECKNLEELIKKFIKPTSFSHLKPLYEKEIGSNVQKIKKETKDISQRILSEIPLNSQQKDLKTALDNLLKDYLASDLEAKYDCLDPQIFELNHSIQIKDGEIEIPLFANVAFGRTSWEFETYLRKEYQTNQLNIVSVAPPIPKQIKQKAKQFSKDYVDTISKTFDDPIMGDLLLRNYSEISSPNFRMYWIPAPSELKIEVEVIDKDPFLVAENFGRVFLVGNWHVKGEKPYEHYLLEFKRSRRN